MILGKHLFVAHVGDSRAMLYRRKELVRLTVDHKPNREDERARVTKAGGHVVEVDGVWRVSPLSLEMLRDQIVAKGSMVSVAPPLQLAVSRAFGDGDLKTPVACVTAEPELTHLVLEENDDTFIILACDGVWDVLKDEEAVEIVSPIQSAPGEAASRLINEAYKRGSKDNISAAVVALKWV